MIATNDIKRWRRLRACTYVIPVIFFLLRFHTTVTIWKENVRNVEDAIVGAGGTVVATLISALPVMLIWWTVSNQMLKSAIRRSRFRNVQDIEYYREKLSGLSPAMISLLTDLHVEEEKDVAATILQLQMKGILDIQNDEAVILKKDDVVLSNSDEILLDIISQPGGLIKEDLKSRLLPWKTAVMQDAYVSPYFKNPEQFQMKACLPGCVTPIISILLIILAACSRPFKYVMEITEIEGLTEEQFRGMLFTDPQLLIGLLLVVLIFLLILVVFVSPILFVIRGVILAQTMENVRLQRTEIGKETMEYIYGLKNFIHDFSNLSEATREQLILWDDFLIYAVLLEENEQILKEIYQKRGMKI